MQVNIQELVDIAGPDNPVYPGKKTIKKFPQPGEYKSHCFIFDWRNEDNLRLELKAGLKSRGLDPQDLRHYPVSFQAPTYLDIAVENDNKKDDDEDEEEEGKGKSGGGGKKPGAVKLEDLDLSSINAFDKAMDGKVPSVGEIKDFVVMGKEIAKEAFGKAFENLKDQLKQTKVMAMDLMKGVSDVIKNVEPGGGLEAKGHETVNYKYDVEKTASMFGGMSPN